jgi:hypothetical protein
MKRIAGLIVGTLVALCAVAHGQSYSESDWHMAFNSKVTRGKVEVQHPTGRIDILTDEYAIEVDHVRNYRAGIKQALQYAAATKRKPGLALFMDGAEDTAQALDAARKLCTESDVRFWLINEYVSVNDLVAQKGATAAPSRSSTEASSSKPVTERVQTIEKTHWLNTSSGVRHNRSCRWFGNTKNGRYCRPDEGRACKQCGG